MADLSVNWRQSCRLTGAPVETYRLCDLDDLPLAQYRLIVFGNAFVFEDEQWERIRKRIPDTATVIWNYAAGVRRPEFSWEIIKDVTGFAVEPCDAGAAEGVAGYDLVHDFPLIRIKPSEDQVVIGESPEGGIMTAMMENSKGGRTILCAFPSLKAGELS